MFCLLSNSFLVPFVYPIFVFDFLFRNGKYRFIFPKHISFFKSIHSFFLFSCFITNTKSQSLILKTTKKKNTIVKNRYQILATQAIAGVNDVQKVAKLILESTSLDPDQYRLGNSKACPINYCLFICFCSQPQSPSSSTVFFLMCFVVFQFSFSFEYKINWMTDFTFCL